MAKCWGRTKTLTQCRNSGGMLWPFCHHHRLQLPIAVFIVILPAFLTNYSGIRAFIDEFFSDPKPPVQERVETTPSVPLVPFNPGSP